MQKNYQVYMINSVRVPLVSLTFNTSLRWQVVGNYALCNIQGGIKTEIFVASLLTNRFKKLNKL